MAKEIDKVVKLQVRGGAANPSPPVGPALGAAGVNIMEFCKQFNARTQDKAGKVLPVVISVYKDKSFEFVIKTPPAAVQLLEAMTDTEALANAERRLKSISKGLPVQQDRWVSLLKEEKLQTKFFRNGKINKEEKRSASKGRW